MASSGNSESILKLLTGSNDKTLVNSIASYLIDQISDQISSLISAINLPQPYVI